MKKIRVFAIIGRPPRHGGPCSHSCFGSSHCSHSQVFEWLLSWWRPLQGWYQAAYDALGQKPGELIMGYVAVQDSTVALKLNPNCDLSEREDAHVFNRYNRWYHAQWFETRKWPTKSTRRSPWLCNHGDFSLQRFFCNMPRARGTAISLLGVASLAMYPYVLAAPNVVANGLSLPRLKLPIYCQIVD